MNEATPTWPDFNVTIWHDEKGVDHIHATVEGRLCNVAYREARYIAGDTAPRYPVPAIVYVPVFECGTLWEYTGNPDNIASSYPTYYRRVR